MRALVTGVAGFIGSTLAKRLVEEGVDVVGVDALTDYYAIDLKRRNLASIGAGAKVVEANLLDMDLARLVRDVDVIFHQAGQPGVRKSWGRDFAIYTKNNVDATQQLLEAARHSPRLSRFVYASSSSVYGDAERFPTEEADRPLPRSPYGVSKLAAEHLCVLYAQNFGVPTTSLRYFTVYGPRQRPDMAFTRFTQASILNEEISVYGTGEQIRDFTYVDDVVEANWLAATTSHERGAVFNVCGGSSATVNEVLDTIAELSGNALKVSKQGAVAGDVFRTGGSSKRIRLALGWEPRVPLREGLKRHLDWAAERVGVSG